MYEKYKVDLPCGKSGNWCIEQFEVTEEQANIDRMRSLFNNGRSVPAGIYTALKQSDHVIMSDTPDEIQDQFPIIRNAKNHVLINGLGIGLVLKAVTEKPEVDHVTVIEISKDVITLAGKHYKDKYSTKLTIINADAFEWKPPKNVRYGAVWHDIWNNISTDNLPEMTRLHRKYGRRTDWQGSWCRRLCKQYAKK